MEFVTVKVKLPEEAKELNIKITGTDINDKEINQELNYTQEELKYLKQLDSLNSFDLLLP